MKHLKEFANPIHQNGICLIPYNFKITTPIEVKEKYLLIANMNIIDSRGPDCGFIFTSDPSVDETMLSVLHDEGCSPEKIPVKPYTHFVMLGFGHFENIILYHEGILVEEGMEKEREAKLIKANQLLKRRQSSINLEDESMEEYPSPKLIEWLKNITNNSPLMDLFYTFFTVPNVDTMLMMYGKIENNLLCSHEYGDPVPFNKTDYK